MAAPETVARPARSLAIAGEPPGTPEAPFSELDTNLRLYEMALEAEPTPSELWGATLVLAGRCAQSDPGERDSACARAVALLRDMLRLPEPEGRRLVRRAFDVALVSSATSAAFPAPLGVRELLEVEEPETSYLVEQLLPTDANLLLAGYPKSGKTFVLLELAVAIAAGRPFLGRYPVPRAGRVGLVLMEDRAHRVRRRLERLAAGHGLALADLDGHIYVWSRPPLRLADPGAIAQLRSHVETYALDFLGVDSWGYVSTGDSDDADVVTPQLDALGGLRTARPGLTVGLVHHARKRTGDRDGERLTDIIRNSSAFGAWYDAGLVVARQDERSPVTVRVELRDLPSPEPFAFTVQDEIPPGPDTGPEPAGWLRLRAAEAPTWAVERDDAAERLVPLVVAIVTANPGCSRRAIRREAKTRAAVVDRALQLALDGGQLRHEEARKQGGSGRWWPVSGDLVPLGPDLVPDQPSRHLVPLGPTTPVGGGTGTRSGTAVDTPPLGPDLMAVARERLAGREPTPAVLEKVLADVPAGVARSAWWAALDAATAREGR